MDGFSQQEEQRLLKTLDKESNNLNQLERRKFLKNALVMLGGGAAAAQAGSLLASSNLPPAIPSWTKQLGDPVLKKSLWFAFRI
ncbi:MAG: hypothetical protein Q9M92_07140 [Enterobacterales bacterium]|nr:hypothetical protein [Enterobacterales bacterium]